MDSKKCQFCEHDNPAGSKYCSECGGCLYLLPCPHCGAVTDVTAATCYQCHGQLQAGKADGLEPRPSTTDVATPDARYFPSPVGGMSKFDALASALPVAEAVRPRPVARLHPRLVAGVALLAVVTAVGYFGYRQRFAVKPPAVPASAGVIRDDVPVANTAVVNTGSAAGSDDTAAPPPATPLSGAMAVPVPAVEAKASVQTDGRRDTKAVVTPAAGKLAADGGNAGERGGAACTPAVAALGLCAAPPVQAKESDADAVLNAANARPPGAGGRADCTQARATLGLCSSTPAPAVPAVTHTLRKE
jgi:hypothetical protein